MWPSAVALSRWVVTNPDEVYNKRILELGAGCGLVGLIAARLLVKKGEERGVEKPSVILTDFNEVVLKNADRNIHLNGVEGIAEAIGLDFYQQTGDKNQWIDMSGRLREQVDLILAADIICQPEDAFAAAKAIHDTLRFGGKAIIICADSKHRFGVERFEEGCLELGLQIRTENVKDIYEGKLLRNCMDKTTGYVDGMSLSMFTVEKPTQ
jgi:predicted nicotinamide N-methyase